ncbi:MAG: HEAT repeat domain-containing protein [Candidatus Marinimicrobia bacterium]|nr:HEAT repeat domain-containing protein [Candidatus Neomarinimicrobiota bacterium]
MTYTMSDQIPQEETAWHRYRVAIYSLVVVPYLIAFFGVVVFTGMRLIVGAPPSIHSAMDSISRGSETERWQSALDMISLLRRHAGEQLDQGFVDQLSFEYNRAAGERKSFLRTYLALAMGLTRDPRFEPLLLEGINDEDEPNRMAAIKALGLVGSAAAEESILQLLKNEEPVIVLESVVALGRIGRASAVPALLPLLDHSEPNIRWDTAISLAKLGDRTGLPIINELLSREYFNQFPQVDINEQEKAVLVAIELALQLRDPIFEDNLIVLSKSDENLTIANAALLALKEF